MVQCMCLPKRGVLQDAEGCRLSHVAGAWLFEAAGLPAVRGDSCGVTLEPCPGAARLDLWYPPSCLSGIPACISMLSTV